MNSVRIEVADNGFTLHYEDPEIMEKNRSSEGWIDAGRTRVYSTVEALTADLAKVLPAIQMMGSKDDADDASRFKQALAEAFSTTKE